MFIDSNSFSIAAQELFAWNLFFHDINLILSLPVTPIGSAFLKAIPFQISKESWVKEENFNDYR